MGQVISVIRGPRTFNISNSEMRTQAIAVVVLAALSVALAQNNCPSGFIQGTGTNFRSCYYFGRSRVDWFAADQYCTHRMVNDYRTHLVAIESSSEQAWLDNYIRNDSELRNNDWWIGADVIDRKRGWVWASTAQRVSYTNWGSGQPDGSGKCGVASWSNSGNTHRWDDISCEGTRRYFVCEYEM